MMMTAETGNTVYVADEASRQWKALPETDRE
jgi:hypothetical protein